MHKYFSSMASELFQAICEDNLENVKKYIRDTNLDFAYTWACKEGKISIVKYLLSNGINIHDYTDADLWCAENKDSELLQYLISQGLSVSNPDQIMYIAAKSGNKHIMEYIISAGIEYNEKQFIEKAVRESNLDTVKYFFSKGLNIHIDNEKLLEDMILDLNFNSEISKLKIDISIDLIIFLIAKDTDLPAVLNNLEGKIKPIVKALLLKYYENNTRRFIGELAVPIECGICLQEMKETNELVQCKICKNCSHLECYRKWSKKCIYCRN